MKYHENTNPLARNCVGCAYSGQASSMVHCAYIFIVGQRRPCPPGDACTVRVSAGRGRPRKVLVHDGQVHSITEWGAILGISAHTIRDRLRRGASAAEALATSAKGSKEDG